MPIAARRVVIAVVVAVGAAAVLHALQADAAAQKPAAEKKAKDYVGKADQKRTRGGTYQFDSGAYRITTDVDKDLANDIAAHMDAVYQVYDRGLAGFKPNPHAAVKPGQRMPLYVLRKYKDYVELLAGFGLNGQNSGGVFFRTGEKESGLATWVEGQSRLKMYYVLQHEGFHQFADARVMPGLPPWVNEGLAEYFGDAVMVDGKLVFGRLDQERIDRMRRAVKDGQTLPFGELMTMTNAQWVGRVTSGDKSASLMYDSAWSVCYYLMHAGPRGKPMRVKIKGQWYNALEAYLLKLNHDYVKDPYRNHTAEAFELIFSNELKNFEKAWKAGLSDLQPDPWFSSIRHLQFVAAALKEFQKKQIEVTDWAQLKEQMIRHKFRTTIRERDAVGRKQRKDAAEPAEQELDFPDPAEVEFVASTDARLPAGLRITNVTPNIVLGWRINAAGDLEENISYVDPPKVVKRGEPAAKKDPEKRADNTAAPGTAPKATE